MKKIIIKLLIIIAVTIVADRLFSWIFFKAIFSKTVSGESGGTVNYLLENKKTADFLILGSSRAKFHINPALLTNIYNGNGYNAGISGTGGLIYNNLLLQLLVSKGAKPKLIILQLDVYPYFTIKDDIAPNEISSLYPFLGENEVVRSYVSNHANYAEKFKLLFHTYRYNGKFLNILYNYPRRNSIPNNNGFEGLNNQFDTSGFQIPSDLSQKHTYSENKLQALTGIVTTCKNNGIPLQVVISPSYENSLLLKEGNKIIINQLRQQAVEHIYDYSDVNSIPALQPATMWKDAAHLNTEGATIFSKILNQAIVIP